MKPFQAQLTLARRPSRSRAKKLIAATGGWLLVAATSLSIGTEPAAAQFSCTPDNVGNINNGKRWYAYAPPNEDHSNGSASFDEYGEILRVRDNDSDGQRVWASLLRCDTDRYEYYSSGPNEGPIDEETYDLDMPEGAYVFVFACVDTPFEGVCSQAVAVNA